jgi:hypothetical protein
MRTLVGVLAAASSSEYALAGALVQVAAVASAVAECDLLSSSDLLLREQVIALGASAILAQVVGAAVCAADAETDWRCP